MRRAGLNPILAATGPGGASTPPGAQPSGLTIPSVRGGTAREIARFGKEMKLLDAQIYAQTTQGGSHDANTARLLSESARLNVDTRLKEIDETLYQKFPWLRLTQMGTPAAAVGLGTAVGAGKLLKKTSQVWKRGRKIPRPQNLKRPRMSKDFPLGHN